MLGIFGVMAKRTRLKKATTLPSKFKPQHLPFNDLGEENFEACCLALCKIAFPGFDRYELKRRKGNAQFGVDVECLDPAGDPTTVLSAKCYSSTSLNKKKLEGFVEDFTSHLDGHWKGKKVDRFVLAITKDGNDDAVNDAIRQQKKKLKSSGIDFEVWFNDKLHGLVCKDRDLVVQYFPLQWAADLFPDDFSLHFFRKGERLHAHDDGVLTDSEVRKLLKHSDHTITDLLEIHIAERRHGNTQPLREYLAKFKDGEPEWDNLDPEIRARIWRLRANLMLDERDVEHARQFMSEAINEARLPDAVLPALIAYHGSGVVNALAEMGEVTKPGELELKAAFLIEKGDVAAAKQVIADCPESSETWRLNSIIALKSGDREKALDLARESEVLSPKGYGNALALLNARLHMALVPNASLASGNSPNPFNPNLVQSTPEARDHLQAGLLIAEKLIDRCTGEQKTDSETWKLALLASHRDQFEASFSYATELINRNQPDTLHIAWAQLLGLELPLGKLRKYLDDAIRQGRGTATHVVVRALLDEEENSTKSNSAAVIKKYIDVFPKDRAFLELWIEQLAGHERKLRQSVADGNKAAAIKFANTCEPKIVAADDWLGFASILGMGKAWPQLYDRRKQLCQFLIPRLHYLAAEAALECDDSEACLEIIDELKTIFPDTTPPEKVRYLRARAQDLTGRIGETLSELIDLNQKNPQAAYQRNIVHLHDQLGKQKDSIPYLKQLVEGNDAETTDYLIAANAGRNYDPKLAQTAVEKLLTKPDLELQAIGNLITLGVNVDALRQDLRERYDQMQRQFFNSDLVTRIDDVEAVMAMIKEAEGRVQELRTKWAGGGIASHHAFAKNSAAFAELMMAGSPWFQDDVGDTYPQIHRTGGLPCKCLPPTSDKKTTLALDVSALLVASRFDLLPVLEQAFQIQVPRCTIAFLAGVLESIRIEVSAKDRATFVDFERKGLAHVGIVSAQSSPLQRFQGSEGAPELLSLLGCADLTKRLSEENSQQLLDDLGIKGDIKPSTALPDVLCVSAALLLTFIRCGVVAEVQKKVTLTTTASELKNLRRAMARSTIREKLASDVTALKLLVSERLVANQWTTIPLVIEEADDQERDGAGVPPDNLLQASLLETLNFALRPDMPLAWIEDRYVSRFLQPSNLLQLPDVLNGLFDRGALTAERHGDWIIKVFESGTGFTGPVLDVIVSVLTETPLEDGAIVETQVLSKMRSTLGRQQVLLPYVDWLEKRTDTDGRPIGEPRFGKDLWLIVPAILKRIWFEKELTHEQRIAIGNWIFDVISLESVRPDDSSAEPEKKYEFVSAFLLDAVLVPFFDAFQNARKGEAKYEPYLEWIFAHRLNERMRLDQELFDTLMRQLADILLAFTEMGVGDDDKEKELVRRIYMRELHAFIDLLPEHVSDGLYDQEGFADKIGVVRDFVLNGSWGSLNCSELTKSIENAWTCHESPIVLKKDGEISKNTFLKLNVEQDAVSSAYISKGSERIGIDATTLMLCAPHASFRLKLFETCHLHEVMDTRLVDQTRSLLAKDLSVTDRLREWDTLSAASFSSKLSRIESACRNENRLYVSWLELPTLDVLANYTKLDPATADPSKARAKAFACLEVAYGKEEANHRLSVLEVMLPLPWTEERSATNEDADHLSIFERTVLHTQKGGGGNEPSGWLRKIDPSLQYVLDFFIFLVHSGANAAVLREDYRKAPDWLSLSLIWVWADRLTQVFFAAGIDLKKTREIHSLHDQRSLDQMLCVDNLSAAFCAGGIDLSTQRVKQHIFDFLTAGRNTLLEVGNDQALLELIGRIDEGNWLPDALLMFEYPTLTGVPSETWDLYPKWVSRGLVEPTEAYVNFGTPAVIDQLLADMDKSGAPAELIGLFSLSIPGSFDEVTLQRLFDLIRSALHPAKNRELEASEKVMLHLFGRVSGELDRTDDFKVMVSDIVAFRHGHGEPEALPNEFSNLGTDHLFSQITEASFAHVKNKPVLIEEKIKSFAEVLGLLFEVWPSSGEILHKMLMRQITITPVSLSDPIWNLVREIRKVW